MESVQEHTAIHAEGLTRSFGDFVAVDGVSFGVREGEIFGMLGPNGAGKSTTIRMLCGLLEPTDGYAEVGGYDVRSHPEQVKKAIGYMAQRFSLYSDLRVRENLRFFGRAYGLSGEKLTRRIAEILERVGLRNQEERLTGSLPVGWKQRLALGCAVLHRPDIVFLDEPTSGVDPVTRRQFWDLIHDLANEGVTTLVTTHYLEEAEYCERMIFIQDGQLIATGASEDLKEPLEDVLFEITTDQILSAKEVLADDPAVESVSLFGSRLHVVLGDYGRREPGQYLRAVLDQSGLEIHDIQQISPSLEDVFIHLSRRDKA